MDRPRHAATISWKYHSAESLGPSGTRIRLILSGAESWRVRRQRLSFEGQGDVGFRSHYHEGRLSGLGQTKHFCPIHVAGLLSGGYRLRGRPAVAELRNDILPAHRPQRGDRKSVV